MFVLSVQMNVVEPSVVIVFRCCTSALLVVMCCALMVSDIVMVGSRFLGMRVIVMLIVNRNLLVKGVLMSSEMLKKAMFIVMVMSAIVCIIWWSCWLSGEGLMFGRVSWVILVRRVVGLVCSTSVLVLFLVMKVLVSMGLLMLIVDGTFLLVRVEVLIWYAWVIISVLLVEIVFLVVRSMMLFGTSLLVFILIVWLSWCIWVR